MTFLSDSERTASLSKCERYRYNLTRTWDRDRELAYWIMLNPSKADALVDDPTIQRVVSFSWGWGFGGVVVLNLFALRSTDPAALASHPDPVGPLNDVYLGRIPEGSPVYCAWGTNVPLSHSGRPQEVREDLAARGIRSYHLGLTKAGHPRHPLYLRSDTVPEWWR